ncbi:hypothetical protein GCM10027162_33420 [Streptomyces incanus]
MCGLLSRPGADVADAGPLGAGAHLRYPRLTALKGVPERKDWLCPGSPLGAGGQVPRQESTWSSTAFRASKRSSVKTPGVLRAPAPLWVPFLVIDNAGPPHEPGGRFAP